jgi:hypothetical protein
MKPEKWVEVSFESYFLGRLLSAMPNDLPSIREARIQTGKLSRMVEANHGRHKNIEAGLRILAGGSLKKLDKEQGKRAQLAGQQARKVRSLCDKVFKEVLRLHNPRLTNAEYRQWRARFDADVAESSRNFVKEVMEKVSKGFIEDVSRQTISRELPEHTK